MMTTKYLFKRARYSLRTEIKDNELHVYIFELGGKLPIAGTHFNVSTPDSELIDWAFSILDPLEKSKQPIEEKKPTQLSIQI